MTGIPSNDIAEMINRVNGGDDELAPQMQPMILANFNIDPTKVESWWSGHLNDSWAPEIQKMTDAGYIAFRVQTEFGINGHETRIYMAKMKKE